MAIKEEQQALSKDQELMINEKKRRTATISNALFIGFLLGIVIYSVASNGFGFFALIPLFFAYRLFNKTSQH